MSKDEQEERWEQEDLDYEGWRLMQENRKNSTNSSSSSSGGCLSALLLLPIMPFIHLFRSLFS